MAKCRECGKLIPLLERPRKGLCKDCASRMLGPTEEELQKKHFEQQRANEAKQELKVERERREIEEAAIQSILLTTETSSNLKVLKRIEVISAEVAFGQNVFKDLFVDVRNIVGGRSATVQNTMRDSRRSALHELKKEAHAIGANAVVGVDLDYVEISSAGTMVLLVATGTAVIADLG